MIKIKYLYRRTFKMISKMVSQAPYVSLLTGAVLILLLTPWLAPAQTDPNQSIPNHSILGQQRQHVLQQALVGSWLAPVGDRQLELLLKSDGNFKLGAQTGSYHIQGLNLNLIMDETSMAYHLDKFVKNELTLSGGDLDAPLTFSKLPLTSLKVSLDNLGDKLVRLLSIILIIGLCRLLLWGLHGLLYFLVYSDAGALKHVHRLHKSRSMTLYSIILNASKYVVYVIESVTSWAHWGSITRPIWHPCRWWDWPSDLVPRTWSRIWLRGCSSSSRISSTLAMWLNWPGMWGPWKNWGCV